MKPEIKPIQNTTVNFELIPQSGCGIHIVYIINTMHYKYIYVNSLNIDNACVNVSSCCIQIKQLNLAVKSCLLIVSFFQVTTLSGLNLKNFNIKKIRIKILSFYQATDVNSDYKIK